MSQRGSALLTVVLLLSLLLPLAAHSVLQGHVDLLIARNLRDQTEALYVAEGALEQALAAVVEAASRNMFLHGPDKIAATPDDGEIAAGSIRFAGEYSASSRAAAFGADKIEIVSIGQARNGSRRSIAAILAAEPAPLTPAALLLAGSARALSLDPTRLSVRGEASPPVAAIAFLEDIAPLLQQGFDLAALRQQLVAVNEAIRLSSPAAPAQMGSPAAPRLSVVESDLLVTGSISGAGVLFIGGSLRISGSLHFDGLVIVMAGVDIGVGAEIQMSGALWQASASEPIVLAGRGALQYSPSSLVLAETVAPGILSHRWKVLGRYDPS